jgi:hypothetical protein
MRILRGHNCGCGDGRILCLSQLAAFYVFFHFLKTTRPEPVRAAANNVKFSYLNGNLMVSKAHALSLSFDLNFLKADRKGRQRFFNCEHQWWL